MSSEGVIDVAPKVAVLGAWLAVAASMRLGLRRANRAAYVDFFGASRRVFRGRVHGCKQQPGDRADLRGRRCRRPPSTSKKAYARSALSPAHKLHPARLLIEAIRTNTGHGRSAHLQCGE